jgi:hypothetical protein
VSSQAGAVAFHELTQSSPVIDPEGLCPHRPVLYICFNRGFRPVGRRALRFIASHEITPSSPDIDPEGLCPHRPGMHERFIASSGPSGDGPSGITVTSTTG